MGMLLIILQGPFAVEHLHACFFLLLGSFQLALHSDFQACTAGSYESWGQSGATKMRSPEGMVNSIHSRDQYTGVYSGVSTLETTGQQSWKDTCASQLPTAILTSLPDM